MLNLSRDLILCWKFKKKSYLSDIILNNNFPNFKKLQIVTIGQFPDISTGVGNPGLFQRLDLGPFYNVEGLESGRLGFMQFPRIKGTTRA